MNRATKRIELPALTADLLNANGVLMDNLFASLWLDIGMFARERIQDAMGKDVLYDTMSREDLEYHRRIACKTVRTRKASGKTAYVVDDSVLQRFGRRCRGYPVILIILLDAMSWGNKC